MTKGPLADEGIIKALSQVFVNVLGVPFTISIQMDKIQQWDSLAHTQLLVAIEEAFGIELPFEDAITMVSGDAIIGVLRKCGRPAST